MCEELIRTKYVYHYTSFETIFALLYGYYKNGSHLSFRASNIYKVNDPNEMVFGFDVIKEIIRKHEEHKLIPIEKRLSEIYNKVEYEQECKRDYLNGKGLNELIHGIIPYVISFSKRRDFLPMWSLYGKQGGGVCLKFDLLCLIDKLKDCICSPVYYSKKKVSCTPLENDINWMYDLYLKHYADNKIISLETKKFELATICLAFAPYFKHTDYMYEKELRFIFNRNYTNRDSFTRTSIKEAYNRIEPFIPIKIPIESLKEIIIGPTADYEVMSHILSLKLKECGIPLKIITQSNISFKHNK